GRGGLAVCVCARNAIYLLPLMQKAGERGRAAPLALRAQQTASQTPPASLTFLVAHVPQLDGAELGAHLERRGARLRVPRAHRHAVALVLRLVALEDDLELMPFAFLEVLDRAFYDVVLGAAQEQVVVALRVGLEVELDVDVAGELLLR